MFVNVCACGCQTVTQAAEKGEAVLMYCKVGKDRTGMLGALIAAACEASEEDILTDYHRCKSYSANHSTCNLA